MIRKALSSPLLYVFIGLLLAGSICSCRVVDTEDPTTISPEPVLPGLPRPLILQIDSLITGSLVNASMAEIEDHTVKAVVTIYTEEGQVTEYDRKRVNVNHEKGVYETEKIDLPIGNYQLTTFYVLTEDNKVSAATPLKKSALGSLFHQALPLPFTVSAQPTGLDGTDEEKMMTLILPAIATEGKKPEDFGLQSFQFVIKEVLQVFIAMVGNQELLDFKSGRLFIHGDGFEHTQTLVAGVNQTPPLPPLSTYNFKVQSQGFSDFSASFRMDSLLAYTSNPLLIELREETIECVGGKYPWSVRVASQTEVNNFGLRCHTEIDGDLIIMNTSEEDPIVDLMPLSTLTTLRNSLEISGNQQLESLEGLHNLSSIYGQITIN